MKITEKRTISASALRELCIANDWYGYGTNDEYSNLLLTLGQCKENLTTNDIRIIAKDIIRHSHIDHGALLDVMNKILDITDTFIVAEEDEKKTKTLNVTIQCMAVYCSSIEVPVNMTLAEAIEYAKENISDIPLGVLEYVQDSDQLDEENCDFSEE